MNHTDSPLPSTVKFLVTLCLVAFLIEYGPELIYRAARCAAMGWTDGIDPRFLPRSRSCY